MYGFYWATLHINLCIVYNGVCSVRLMSEVLFTSVKQLNEFWSSPRARVFIFKQMMLMSTFVHFIAEICSFAIVVIRLKFLSLLHRRFCLCFAVSVNDFPRVVRLFSLI